jgi:hypothetical protein
VTLGVKETAVSPDDRTTISAEVGGEGYNGLSHFMFAIRDGLVSRMTIRQ